MRASAFFLEIVTEIIGATARPGWGRDEGCWEPAGLADLPVMHCIYKYIAAIYIYIYTDIVTLHRCMSPGGLETAIASQPACCRASNTLPKRLVDQRSVCITNSKGLARC